jgi:acetoin utilization deacetylase AcuC-like enzyme
MPLPAQHKFPIQKYGLLREQLERDGYFLFEPAPLADVATIELVHEREYVEAFLHGTLSAAAVRKIGFPWSEGLVTRTLASVGSTLAATREALTAGWGGALAGGTHHAFAGEGSGFCVFNDIAVAARWVQVSGALTYRQRTRRKTLTSGDTEEHRESASALNGECANRPRVAVIDLDVHQGDGTAHIFREERSVMTLSVHCKANFPLRKQQSVIDVEFEAGIGDEEYLRVLEQILPRVWEFAPEIVFYQAGVDGLGTDRLGRLKLTHAGLRARDRMVMRGVRELGVPFVITIGGGYSEPVELTAEAHANTFRMAREVLWE